MSSARISADGKYRYVLTRDGWLGGNGSVAFVMLNPSTADAETDDRTIRRCIGFAQSWGFARLSVVNLYAYRATKPASLALVKDPVGPENDGWLHETGWTADEVVVAWGAHRFARKRAATALGLLQRGRGERLKCITTTQAGYPAHPLYLRASERLKVYAR